MYYFLGIVEQHDLVEGRIQPAFILCQSHGVAQTRSGWRVIKQSPDNAMTSMPKVLTTSLIGNEAMIDFLCSYNTRDHMHGDKHYTHEETKKYFPVGALCWFGCNCYGEPNGYAVLIRKVPDTKGRYKQSGFQRLKAHQEYRPSWKELLSRDLRCIENERSGIKPRLAQKG